MSERGSFTTEYIYDNDDYKIVRKALDLKSKYLCISPPATWNSGKEHFEMPIVSGKVGDLCPNCEWLTIVDKLENVKTHNAIKIVVMCDSGNIVLLTKTPEGEIDYQKI